MSVSLADGIQWHGVLLLQCTGALSIDMFSWHGLHFPDDLLITFASHTAAHASSCGYGMLMWHFVLRTWPIVGHSRSQLSHLACGSAL